MGHRSEVGCSRRVAGGGMRVTTGRGSLERLEGTIGTPQHVDEPEVGRRLSPSSFHCTERITTQGWSLPANGQAASHAQHAT